MRIEACLDSHVHWAATGEFEHHLRLETLQSPNEVKTLKIEPYHRRGDWILGFGWDETSWDEKPTRAHLDKIFPDQPVAFTRRDGHALWVNGAALHRAGDLAAVQGGRVELDTKGAPTGVLVDQAMAAIENLIPRPEPVEVRRHLLQAVKIFNDAGFTHIRDMTCDERQWNEALKLDSAGLLTLAVEEYFWLKDLATLEASLKLIEKAKASASSNLRVMGLKVFLDGALGSEGAWLSHGYHGGENHGLILWSEEDLREVFIRTWEKGFAVAVHAIGDRAAEKLVQIALKLKGENHQGKIHIEHGELMSPETIQKMKDLDIECHLQPAHWLSDQLWLKNKVGSLASFAFPWRRLQEAGIAFDFGSDAPIEKPNLKNTLLALKQSAEAGIPRLLGSATNYLSHRDLSWAPNSYTLFIDEQPKQVVFRGEHLL